MKDDGRVSGCGAVGVDIHDDVGAGGLLPAARNVFAGAGQPVLQAIDRVPIQVMRCGVYRAMVRRFGDLQIIAVLAGAAVHAALPHVQRRHRRVDGFQRKAVHGRSHEHDIAIGGSVIGVIRDGEGLFRGFSRFGGQHIERAGFRPFERAVREIVAVQVAHLVPPTSDAVLLNGFDLYGGIPRKTAREPISVAVLVHGLICPGLGRDRDEIPRLGGRKLWRKVLRCSRIKR